MNAFAINSPSVGTPGEEHAAHGENQSPVTSAASNLQELADRVAAVLRDSLKGYHFNDYSGNFFIVEDNAGMHFKPEPRELPRPAFSGPDYHEKIKDFALRLKNEGCNEIPPSLLPTLTVHVVVSIDLPTAASANSNAALAAELAKNARRLLPSVALDIRARPLTRNDLAERVNKDNWQIIQSAMALAVDSDSTPLNLASIRAADSPDGLISAIQSSNKTQPVFFPAVWARNEGEPAAGEAAIREVYKDFRKASVTTRMGIRFDHDGIHFKGSPEDLRLLSGEHPLVLRHGSSVEPVLIERSPEGKDLIILQSTGGTPMTFKNITEILEYTKGEAFSIDLSKDGERPGVEIVSAYPVVRGLKTGHELDYGSFAFIRDPNRDPALRPQEWNVANNDKVLGAIRRTLVKSTGTTPGEFIGALRQEMRGNEHGRRAFPGFGGFTEAEHKFLAALYDYYNFRSTKNLENLCEAMGLSVHPDAYSQKKVGPTLDLMAGMGFGDRERLRKVLDLADKNHYKKCGPAMAIFEILGDLGIRTSLEDIHGVVEARDKRMQGEALGEAAVAQHR